MRLFVRVVVAGVVAADHAPAGLIGRVAVGPVQHVGMEEERIARLHLDVDQGQPLEDLLDPVLIGAGLLAGEHMVDPAQAVRALDHLEAAILRGARVDGYENADQVGEEDAVLQRFPLNLSCERKTICNMLFGNWLWQLTRSSHCTLSMLLVL
jgi:hypothetical protein